MSTSAGGVQSVNRALDLLELLARGPMAVGDLATAASLAVPTAHRLARTLVERGYVQQLADRRYALGYGLVPLGRAADDLAGVDVETVLAGLVEATGESANVAILVGDQAQYLAQSQSRHAMRMFTEVGRRVDLHCTGVGKAMLAQLDDAAVEAIVGRRGLLRHTETTISTPAALRTELAAVRSRGYALDEQEQEVGVRCVAVPVDAGAGSWLAVSVSGPAPRMTDAVIARAVPLLRDAGARLVAGRRERLGQSSR